MDFVRLSTTTWAPCASGWQTRGFAKVLSTTKVAPALRACAATRVKSSGVASGLAKVSA